MKCLPSTMAVAIFKLVGWNLRQSLVSVVGAGGSADPYAIQPKGGSMLPVASLFARTAWRYRRIWSTRHRAARPRAWPPTSQSRHALVRSCCSGGMFRVVRSDAGRGWPPAAVLEALERGHHPHPVAHGHCRHLTSEAVGRDRRSRSRQLPVVSAPLPTHRSKR